MLKEEQGFKRKMRGKGERLKEKGEALERQLKAQSS
jgi:hypothetical protein